VVPKIEMEGRAVAILDSEQYEYELLSNMKAKISLMISSDELFFFVERKIEVR